MSGNYDTATAWIGSDYFWFKTKRQAKRFQKSYPNAKICYHPSKFEKIVRILRGQA